MLRHVVQNGTGGTVEKQVAVQAAFEEYFSTVSKFNSEYPECWHIIMQAGDQLRAETFDRFRRNLHAAFMKGRLPFDVNYDPDAPWSAVFIYAAKNSDYWQENVVRPSQNLQGC